MPAEEKPTDAAAAGAPLEPSALMGKVLGRLGGLVIEWRREFGQDRVEVARENVLEACRRLRDSSDLAFNMLVDLTAVDYLGNPDGFSTPEQIWDASRAVWRRQPQSRHKLVLPPRGPLPRFAVVYNLLSTKHVHRLRMKARVPEEDPTIASVSGIWPGANWLERETYDLYGIRFTGHPDLRRIYLYEEFVGHPLRKDYDKHHEQPLQEYVGPGAKEPRRPR